MKNSIIRKLKKLGVCGEAIEYAKTQKSRQAAWDNCERGDWMLWLVGKKVGKPETPSRKKLLLIRIWI